MSRTIIFSGKSGEQYRFQIWPLGTAFKAVAGVYIVTQRTAEDRTFPSKGSHRPVMIGCSDDLSKQLFTAEQQKAFEKRGAEYICLLAIADFEERARIERDLLDAHDQAGGFLQHLIEPQAPQAKPGPPFKTTP